MRALFDTNVVSETMRSKPDARVVRCVKAVLPEDSYVSVITFGELIYGMKRLSTGTKRSSLEAWLSALEQTYASRILDVDLDTTRIWGELTPACETKGRSLQPQDGLIAATALQHGLHLVTRNTTDFEHTGVLMVNPWES